MNEGTRGKSPDDRLRHRLVRIEGQVRGLQRLLDQGCSTEEVLVQTSAAVRALEAFAAAVLDRHLNRLEVGGATTEAVRAAVRLLRL